MSKAVFPEALVLAEQAKIANIQFAKKIIENAFDWQNELKRLKFNNFTKEKHLINAIFMLALTDLKKFDTLNNFVTNNEVKICDDYISDFFMGTFYISFQEKVIQAIEIALEQKRFDTIALLMEKFRCYCASATECNYYDKESPLLQLISEVIYKACLHESIHAQYIYYYAKNFDRSIFNFRGMCVKNVNKKLKLLDFNNKKLSAYKEKSEFSFGSFLMQILKMILEFFFKDYFNDEKQEQEIELKENKPFQFFKQILSQEQEKYPGEHTLHCY